jgi:hypothetical protein
MLCVDAIDVHVSPTTLSIKSSNFFTDTKYNKHIPCLSKCHFLHVPDVPDCVGPGGPADVNDGLTETRVVELEVGAGVSIASTHTRTQ